MGWGLTASVCLSGKGSSGKGTEKGGLKCPFQHLAKLHDSVGAMHLSLLGGRRHCVDSIVHDSLDMQKTLTRQVLMKRV